MPQAGCTRRRGVTGNRRLLRGAPALLHDDLVAQVDALVADVHAGAGDQFEHLVLALSAERALQELAVRHPVSVRAVARRPGSFITSMAFGSCSLMAPSWVTTSTWRNRARSRSRAISMRALRSSSRGPNTSSS